MTGPSSEPTDAGIEAHLLSVSPQAWAAIWSAADDVAAEPVHLTWEGGGQMLPYPVYSPAVQRLRTALGALVVVFSWPGWTGVHRYRGGSGMAEAPVADAVRMVTAVLRSERFTDGSIDGALRDGTLSAAVERLRAWHAQRDRTDRA